MLKNQIHSLLWSRRLITSINIAFFIGAVLLLPPHLLSQSIAGKVAGQEVPEAILLRIVRAEDERRWDRDLGVLLSSDNPAVRKRAALAAGRIGNERAVELLVPLLENDPNAEVRAMSAFALGEIESGKAVDALVSQLNVKTPVSVKARSIEALGKIAASLPKTEEALAKTAGKAILDTLEFEAQRRSGSDFEVISLGITAALRAKPEGAGKVIAEFLTYSDPLPALAANALARLRTKDGNAELLRMLASAKDPVARANAARVLGATEEAAAFEALSNRAINDPDARVRVSAIRALVTLKNPKALETLLNVGPVGLPGVSAAEVLELASAIGRLAQGTANERALLWLKTGRKLFPNTAPEIEIALVRVSPAVYLGELGTDGTATTTAQEMLRSNWRAASSFAQALGEIAALPDSASDKSLLATRAQEILRAMLAYRQSNKITKNQAAVHSEYAIPDVLRAFAAFKPADLAAVLRKQLNESDVVVRATTAELLGELPPNAENAESLTAALKQALSSDKLNDAALAILEALGKQKTEAANASLESALNSRDQLIRSRAAEYLKTNGAGDFSSRVGIQTTGKTSKDYQRAIARAGNSVRARVITSRGTFTIELLPGEAPLNVENFVQLARSGYFNGITFHRVVPNFVVQGGDPRGDGNGGPGYSVRCEINEVPYERGAVGMALSGKDTGGSQWFVTHSPQPHLNGGYTVFGNVVNGMEVVDAIVRGDVIRSIVISETKGKTGQL